MPDKVFNYDSPFIRGLLKAADVLWLNILTVLLMIPVITFGPALSALSYTCLKMARDEDSYVTKMYFKAFKTKFWQSAGLGIIGLLALVFLGGGGYAVFWAYRSAFPLLFKIAFGIAATLVASALIYVFPLQGRFSNTIPQTIKNAFWASLVQAPKTLLMLLMWLFIPALILFVSGNFTPLIFLFGIGGPAYFNAVVYNPLFKQMEHRIRVANGEETDEPDETDDAEDGGKGEE